MAETEGRKFKTDWIRKQIFYGYGEEIRNRITGTPCSSVGLELFRPYIYGKPVDLLTNHQALEPIIKRNRSNKTHSARLTKGWLDQRISMFK